jgi:hypothetical protein
VLELQGCFETFGAEEVDIIVEHAVKKLVRASNILPHSIDEIITAAIQRRIDCQELMLYITQLLLNASKVQAQPFQHPPAEARFRSEALAIKRASIFIEQGSIINSSLAGRSVEGMEHPTRARRRKPDTAKGNLKPLRAAAHRDTKK